MAEQAPPRTLALKTSSNNKYLSYIAQDAMIPGLLKFSAGSLSKLSTFEVEIAKSGDGLVHLKCSSNNKYWRRWSPDHKWIAAEADEPEEDQSKWSCTLFQPIFVAGNADNLQLLHVQIGGLIGCSLKADEPFKYCLFAAGKDHAPDQLLDTFTITNLVPVLTEIKDVNFGLKDAKIYDKTTIELATGVALNNDEHASGAKVVTLEYDKTERGTWKGSNSLNSDVVTDIKSAIPVIVNENAVLSGNELAGPYQWGETVESTYRVKTAYKVIVPPMTMVIVKLKATQASFDVPFSYLQHQTLANGTESTNKMNDGIYTGVNLYNFRYEATQKKIQNK